jgi:hypothetical protein
MARDLKFHSSKLSFLYALDPPCSNLVTLFKPLSQSLCLSLPLNSSNCDLTGCLPTSHLLLPVLYIVLFSHSILP